jgi:ribulose-bisphosphate carboxylase large chain
MAHPQGVAAGVASLKEAWEAAMAGEDLAEYARTRPALAAAIGAYA